MFVLNVNRELLFRKERSFNPS